MIMILVRQATNGLQAQPTSLTGFIKPAGTGNATGGTDQLTKKEVIWERTEGSKKEVRYRNYMNVCIPRYSEREKL